jgi:uncharacterized protein (DUF58 family)
MILPAPRCLLVLGAGLPVALLPALVEQRLWPLWLLYVAGAVLACGIDAISGPPAAGLGLSARPPRLLCIGAPEGLTLELSWPAPYDGTLEMLCELDELLVPQPVQSIRLPARGTATVQVLLVPRRRGKARVAAVWMRYAGPLGLMLRVERRALELELPVVPDVRFVHAAALRFQEGRDSLSGLKIERTIGDGTELEALREYVPGLDPRSIDWKASARHTQLLCRELRAERNHQVILAFDTGRVMSESLEGIPRLDHAINAALMLGYVCLKAGDRVGLYAFDESVRLETEPRGGIQALQQLLQRTAEIQYTSVETNFTRCLTHLATRLRRRSLIVVQTELADTVMAELMVEGLERLGRRHLVVFVALQDPALARLAEALPNSAEDLGRAVVSRELATERELVLMRLRRAGIFCIDAAPAQISTQLVNRYLEIKRRELV